MLRIYTASKLSAAPVWQALHAEWPEAFCHARWLKHTALKTPDTPDRARRFWVEDEEDVRNADFVVLYGREGEHLRGALVEAGMGIAYGKPVVVVGQHPDYGTWQHHPSVIRAKTFDGLQHLLRAYLDGHWKPGQAADWP